jgi:hypothetical protein
VARGGRPQAAQRAYRWISEAREHLGCPAKGPAWAPARPDADPTSFIHPGTG